MAAELAQLKEVIWAFVLPAICLFGLLTNTLNVLVLSQSSRHKNRMHSYFLMDSALELAYLTICLVHFVQRSLFCPRWCHSFVYFAIYEKYMYFFAATGLAYAMIFLKLFVTFRRLALVYFAQTAGARHGLLCLLFAFSFVFEVPALLGTDIVRRHEDNNSTATTYRISFARLDESLMFRVLISAAYAVRGLLAPVILLTLNVLIMRRINAKTTLQASQKVSFNVSLQTRKSLTKMIVVINFLFIVPNLVFFVVRVLIFRYSLGTNAGILFSTTSNVLLFLSHSSSFFVYYSYDALYYRLFRKRFYTFKIEFHCGSARNTLSS